MTQMLLFDAPQTAVVPSAAPEVGSAREPATPSAQATCGGLSANRIAQLEDRTSGELKRMGDLAKLVLLRYELVHQRRARRMRRQAIAR